MKIKKTTQATGVIASVKQSKTESDTDTYSCNYINAAEKPKRKVLFNNSSNTSKTIELSDSAYNYSYLYVHNSSNYSAMIPIYSDEQTNLRGVGGWSGPTNAGTNHFYGSLSNEGKTINVTYFRALVHTAGGTHNDGDDYDVTMVVGIR